MSLSATSRWSNVASKHLIIMLIATFGIYFYRDLFPLATFTRTPRDLSEGWVLWTKVVILALTSIGIPLFIPRQYKPVDPEVSFFSFIFYGIQSPKTLGSYGSSKRRTNRLYLFISYIFFLRSHCVPSLSGSTDTRPTATAGRL